MSEWVSGIKLTAEGLGKLYRIWLVRRDPIRAQAQRVLDVFAAHGVAPTQIGRLLPAQFTVPMQDFASASALKAHLTPALLDWVADFFALNRAWLDGVSREPHKTICCYKYPLEFARWLAEHKTGEPFQFRLFVLKPSRRPICPESNEDIVITLEERIADLDDQSICRYYLFDGSGPLNHYPVIRSLMGICAVAGKFLCTVKGLVVKQNACEAVEEGQQLVPLALRKARNSWQPDDLLFQIAGNDLPWQRQLRADIEEDLADHGDPAIKKMSIQ